MARYFIDRPIFAWVIAIVIMIAGALAIVQLPISRYPTIAPPTVATVVRVVNDVLRSPLGQRHVQGIQHQLGAQVVLDRPADDLVRPDIQHQGEVDRARPGRHVRRVGDPQLIRSVRLELPLYQILVRSCRPIRRGGHHVVRRDDALEARFPHQSRDPLAPHVHVVIVRELGMDVRRAVAALGSPIDLMDPGCQANIRPAPGRQRPILPSIESTGRHLKQSAHHPYRLGGLVRPTSPRI